MFINETGEYNSLLINVPLPIASVILSFNTPSYTDSWYETVPDKDILFKNLN